MLLWNIFVFDTLKQRKPQAWFPQTSISYFVLGFIISFSHLYIFSVEPDVVSNVALKVNPLYSSFGTG